MGRQLRYKPKLVQNLSVGTGAREIYNADAGAEVEITLNLYAVSPSSGTLADHDAPGLAQGAVVIDSQQFITP